MRGLLDGQVQICPVHTGKHEHPDHAEDFLTSPASAPAQRQFLVDADVEISRTSRAAGGRHNARIRRGCLQSFMAASLTGAFSILPPLRVHVSFALLALFGRS